MGLASSKLTDFPGDPTRRYAIRTARRDVPEYPLPDSLMREQFRLHDVNGNGTIDLQEMVSIMRQTFDNVDGSLLRSVRTIFTVADINGNEVLSYNEFRHLLFILSHYTDTNDCVQLAADVDHDFVITYEDFFPVLRRYERVVGRVKRSGLLAADGAGDSGGSGEPGRQGRPERFGRLGRLKALGKPRDSGTPRTLEDLQEAPGRRELGGPDGQGGQDNPVSPNAAGNPGYPSSPGRSGRSSYPLPLAESGSATDPVEEEFGIAPGPVELRVSA